MAMAQHKAEHSKHYMHLAIMTALSFVAMYVLMYAMVDRLGYVYANINQAYMAALMAAPMALIEVIVMRSMYASRPLNYAIIAGLARSRSRLSGFRPAWATRSLCAR
jgi:hypothetical protein